MSEANDILAKTFSRYLRGYALSKAIFEDYVKVVAELLQKPEDEIRSRIETRTKEIFNEVIEEQRADTEQWKQKK